METWFSENSITFSRPWTQNVVDNTLDTNQKCEEIFQKPGVVLCPWIFLPSSSVIQQSLSEDTIAIACSTSLMSQKGKYFGEPPL